jgi:hypothetical protein
MNFLAPALTKIYTHASMKRIRTHGSLGNCDSFDVVLPKTMMPPSHATPAPEAPCRTKVSTAEVVDPLWEEVLVEAGPLKIHSNCEQQLRKIVEQGVERMTLENRTTPDDIATAEQNLGRFVGLMKHNATDPAAAAAVDTASVVAEVKERLKA